MDIMEAMRARHSVRSYTDKPIEGETLQSLEALVDECNREGGLHIQLVRNEPMAFGSALAHYGKFSGVKNYRFPLKNYISPGLKLHIPPLTRMTITCCSKCNFVI